MSSPTWRVTLLPRSMVVFRSFVESVSSTVHTLTICAQRPWCHNHMCSHAGMHAVSFTG